MIALKLFSMLLLAYVYYTEAIPHRFVEPEETAESFSRYSVEHIPIDDAQKMSLRMPSYNDIEGVEEQQFSRAAVESVPKTIVSDYRPLRLAVEYNPKEESFSRSHSRKERFLNLVLPDDQRHLRAYNPQAYVVPVYNPYGTDPLHYRTGSPYQQLVDIRTLSQLTTQPNAAYGNIKMTGLDRIQQEEKYKVICHITNWAFYRKEEGRFAPENLDYSLCTHVIYSFASLDPNEFVIREFDPWVDIENNLYIRTVNAAGGKPVYLAIGGWTDSTFGKYSKLVADRRLREKFIENAVPFLKRFGFSGLHIDWNYPTCPQSDCKNGDERDREHFTDFIKELNYRLKQSDIKLSISVSGYKEILVQGYNFVELSENVEFITVMTYDYHGAWENITGHVSPLYGSSTDRYPQYNTNYTINLLRELGADMRKVILGYPFYAQSYTLGSKKKSLRGFNAPAIGPGEPGELTNQPGMLGYNEICNLLRRPNFKKGVDPSGNSGPYITDGSIWAGFDDSAMVLKKTQYVIDNGLGGASAWTVDLDDFNNNCCLEPFPLLRAINRGFGRIDSKIPTGHNCEKPVIVTPPPAVMSVTEDSGQAGIPMSTADDYPQSTSPWWTQSTTTRRPAIQSTSRKPSQEDNPSDSTPIPAPVNVMPVYNSDESCVNGKYKKHPTSCNMYLICVGNVYQEQPCPQKLHWNDAHNHCDWPASANCQIAEKTTTMPEKTTTTSRKPRPTKTQATTTVTEETTKVTRSTTKATRSTTKRRTSRKPTTVRDPIETTQRPTYAEITTTIYTTTSIPETTTTTRRRTTRRSTTTSTASTTESTTTKKPQKKPAKCDNGQFYPSKDCTKYYICSNNRKVKMSCPEGLQYSQKLKYCDYEDNVKCVSRKKYMKLLQKQYKNKGIFTASLLKASEGDPCEGQSYLAYPGDCSKYLICNHEQLLEMSCPPGLSFNPANTICDWPQNVDCSNDPSTNEEDGEDEEEEEEEETENEVIDESSGWNDDTNYESKPSSSVKPPPQPSYKPSVKPTSSTMKPTQSTKPSKPTKPTKPAKPSRDPVTSLQTIPVKDHVEPLTGKFKLICYFTNWAWYRPGAGKYLPDDIDENLCTHIVYGFAVLNYDELVMRPHDSWADIDNRFYERVVAYKSKGIKVTLAIGGWNDSAGDKYSRLVRNAAARAKFIKHAVEFLMKHGFDGLDLDWEYPVCWQVDCKKGYPEEKQDFATFVRELSAAFKPKGLLLSAAVSPSKTVIDAGYDVAELSKYMDWIAVMCYDYHGQWDKKTGHIAPFYHHPDDDVDFFNVDYTIKYWIEKGAALEKIILGMPLYGQAFTLADPNNNGLNAKSPGGGTAGEFTRAAGFLAYYEICDRIFNRDWKVVQDSKGRLGPYAYSGNQWVSFDDQAMLQKKTQYIIDMGLGGGMVWALDLDDFRGNCGQGKHPLLKIIHATLQDGAANHISGEDEYDEDEEDEEEESPVEKPMPEEEKPVEEEGDEDYVDVKPIEQKPVTQKPQVVTHKPQTHRPVTVTQKPQTVTQKPDEIDEEEEDTDEIDEEETDEVEEEDYEDEEQNEIDEFEGQYKVVCYFTNWAWYRPGIGKFKPEDIDDKLCTHIVYGFAVLNRDTLTIQPHDSWADIDNKFYERVVEFKKKGIKVTIAIGGWNDSAGDKYSRLVRDAAARARFIKHVIEFIEKYRFDGLDLDWEYPVCWQVECDKGHPDEKQNFASFVEELSIAFKPKRLLLSSAVSPSKRVIDAGYDVKKLSKHFDWIAVMAYDYHGQWDKKTGHVAPMYVHPDDSDKTFNSNFTLNYWIDQGADPRKLVFGMPMYGQSFSLASRTNTGLNSPTYGGGEAGEETRARGFLSYYEICDRIKNQKWTVVRDPRGAMGPYAYKGDQWVSFDDYQMIKHKSEYVKALGLGGAMIWALDLDDFKNSCGCEEYPLLRTINRVLRNYPAASKNCNLESRIKPPTAEETTKAPEMTTVKLTTTTAVSVPYKPTKKKTTSRPKPTSTTVKSTTYEGEDYEEEEEDTDLHDTDSCVDGTYFPHETDCSKYYICNFNSKLEQSCMYGLQWNQKTMNCDWPSAVQCISKDEEHEIEKEDEEDEDEEEEDNDIDLGHETLSSPKPSKKPVSTTQKPTTMSTTRKPKPTRPPIETNPFIPTGNNDYMVVCYFTNWAWYRPGIGKYKPDDIDSTLCTHVVYGFAVLNGQTLTIRTHDSWADIDNNFYTKVTALKEKGIKVSIAIGGWNDSLGDKYSRLVRSPEARRKFIENVIEFMKKYDFQGLDLDWEYPVCWQVDCTKGKPEEKEAFTAFVRELHEAFEPEGFLLSAAVSPAKKVIDAGYDIPELTKYFDWIAVMCYDYHGQWDKVTGHVAPLFHHPESREETFNANYTMNYWIEQGADRKKLVMGMPTYGQSFSLEISASKNTPGLNTKAPAGGQAGEFTRSAGFLAFYEICHKVNTGGWTVVKDPNGAIGSYAYKDRQWVSYDDVEQIRRKTQYVKDLGIGGAMIWALDLDDFRNRCGCGAHPLLSTINLELGRINTPRLSDCT